MKHWKYCIVLSLLLTTRLAAQDILPLVPTPDTRYFDFWVGTWQLLREDGTLDTTTSFVVKRSIHSAAYEETWKQGGNVSKAVRAWDKTNNR